jgi:predicted Zn finger-like uncharacterized protein
MSELLVAQCPFCQTRFRLSQDHLQAAAGNVRCGACLKVFNARLAIAGEPQAEDQAAARPAPPPPPHQERSIPRPGPLMIHDDLDLDDLDLESLGLDESILEEINPAARLDESAEQSLPDQAEFHLEPEPEPETEPEPVPDQPLQPDAVSDTHTEADQKAPDSEPDPWDMLDEPSDEPDAYFTPQGRVSEPDTLGGTDDADDLHEDFLATPMARDFAPRLHPDMDPDQTIRVTPARPAEQSGIFLRDRPAESGRIITARRDEEQETDRSQEPDPDPEPTATNQRQEPEIGNLIELPELREEPLLLYEQPKARRSRYRPLWILLSVLALIGLPAQALYYNFTTLAHGEQSRPYLEQFCFLTGCELPARVDITLVRSSNLMVRPHPEYPKALAIDVILYNRADFAQPFPVLRMTFNDTRGREVLSKRFRPDEYLGGELAGATLMPPQTPVHVALDMLDPGPEAAGYQLDFLSP